MKKVLFLDFDGVLHRKMNGDFGYMANLFKVLDIFPDIMVVISSDWRDILDETNYWKLFGDYSNRITGKITTLPGLTRELEILDYAYKNKLDNFIAVDDDCRGELFSTECNWLFRTNYFKGLDLNATEDLINFIKNRFTS